jgi:ABC-type bacteriocin/lantibiotic exporter with double-glycine peptidase domain
MTHVPVQVAINERNRSIFLIVAGFLVLNGILFSLPRIGTTGGQTGGTPPQSADELRVEDPSNPCGPTAAAVVGLWHGRSLALAEVKSAIPCDALGRTSMAELRRGMVQLGFACEGIRVKSDLLSKLQVPAILFVNGNHFVVVAPTADEDIVVIDPPRESRRVRADSLPFAWKGELLLCASTRAELDQELKRLNVRR